jgi:predicted ATPase
MIDAARGEIGSHEVTHITFRCSPYDAQSALRAMRVHLERVVQLLDDGSAQAKWGKLENMLAQYDFPQSNTALLLAKLLSIPSPEDVSARPLTPAQEKERTAAVLISSLTEESERHPVLVVSEDLHFADPSSLDLIGLFVEQLPTMRAMLLLTARPEYQASWVARSHVASLTLGRLEPSHIEAICGRIAGGRKLPEVVLEQIIARTDGVPLFIEELTKTILESDVLRDIDGSYELTQPLTSVSIPVTLNDSLTARLDQLGPAKAVTQITSVIGRTVDYGLLLEVTGRDEDVLTEFLRQLVRQRPD